MPTVRALEGVFAQQTLITADAGYHSEANRLRREEIRGLAIVLVALDLGHTVLDDQQAGDALVCEIVVHRQATGLVDVPAIVWLALRRRQAHRGPGGLKHVRLVGVEESGQLGLMRERSDPDGLVGFPVAGRPDRVALGLAEPIPRRARPMSG